MAIIVNAGRDARSTAIRLLVGNSADPEIVSTSLRVTPMRSKVDTDAVVEEEEGRQEFVSDRDERIYGIGYRDFPRVIQGIGCFLSPRQLESRIRFSPIFASSGVCIIGCVYRE